MTGHSAKELNTALGGGEDAGRGNISLEPNCVMPRFGWRARAFRTSLFAAGRELEHGLFVHIFRERASALLSTHSTFDLVNQGAKTAS